jgi:hypothetical protein
MGTWRMAANVGSRAATIIFNDFGEPPPFRESAPTSNRLRAYWSDADVALDDRAKRVNAAYPRSIMETPLIL